jgi:hypothetical protein
VNYPQKRALTNDLPPDPYKHSFWGSFAPQRVAMAEWRGIAGLGTNPKNGGSYENC